MEYSIPKLSALFVAIAFSGVASAAKITIQFGGESGKYPTDYSYQGMRTDLTINPDGSNWYFKTGYRNRDHDTGQNYTRYDLGASYRFRMDGAWIQPGFEYRQDKTNYRNAAGLATNQLQLDKYQIALDWSVELTDNLTTYGTTSFGIERQHEKLNKIDLATELPDRKTDYFIYEVEPGFRYSVNKWSNIALTYYQKGSLSEKGTVWGLTDDSIAKQARLYVTINTPIGLTLTPYIRYSIDYAETDAWYDSAAYDELKTKSKLTRYAIRAQYPITKNWGIAAEYYRESTKYKERFALGKDDQDMDYYRLSAVFNF